MLFTCTHPFQPVSRENARRARVARIIFTLRCDELA